MVYFVYKKEISPEDQQKRGKQGKDMKHHSSNHHSKFFVSPFKSTNRKINIFYFFRNNLIFGKQNKVGQVIQNTLGGGSSSSSGNHHIHNHMGSSKFNVFLTNF